MLPQLHDDHPPRLRTSLGVPVGRPRLSPEARAAVRAQLEADPTLRAAAAARLVGIREIDVRRAARVRLAVALLEAYPAAGISEAARICRTCERRVAAAWRDAHPEAPSGRRITLRMHEARIEPFAALCDSMAEQLTDRPQTAGPIFAATVEMHGEVGERRLWRALRRLVETRRARKIVGNPSATYTKEQA